MVNRLSVSALSHAARLRVVAKYWGQLTLIVAALLLVPLAVAVGFDETAIALRLTVVLVLLAATGALSARIPFAAPIQANEALVVTALAYLTTSVALIWPFMVALDTCIDAWFESVSAVTTTGLSTFTHVDQMPRTLLFTRAYMQWFGGLGIVVLSVALLNRNDVSLQRLLGKQGGEGEGLVATTRIHARRMLVVYGALTLFAIALIGATGAPWFDAVCHALAAISTGGFSTHDASLGGFPGHAVPASVTLVTVLGAISLPVYVFAYRGQWGRMVADEQVRALLLLIVVVSVGFYLFESGWRGPQVHEVGRSILMGTSALTTSGFSSGSVADLNSATKLWLVFAMACGGGLGSTAGGIKLIRVIIMARLLQLLLRRLAMPNRAVSAVRVAGQSVGTEEISLTAIVILLFCSVTVLSWLPFVAAGYDPLDALFEVTSATATVGLSTGIVASGLAPALKALLCLDMLAGRVEFIALLVLVYPGTWFGPRSDMS